MNEIGTGPARPLRKHQLPPQALSRPGAAGQQVELTRHHGQGNGMRVHTLFFAAASLVALVMMIAAVVVANARV